MKKILTLIAVLAISVTSTHAKDTPLPQSHYTVAINGTPLVAMTVQDGTEAIMTNTASVAIPISSVTNENGLTEIKPANLNVGLSISLVRAANGQTAYRIESTHVTGHQIISGVEHPIVSGRSHCGVFDGPELVISVPKSTITIRKHFLFLAWNSTKRIPSETINIRRLNV